MNREQLPLLVTFFCTSLLIAACGSQRPSDGPPQGGTNIPRGLPGNAIPKVEPRSRYGNGPIYQVRGETYQVMDSSRGYQERGVASWYGKKFHGRMTSNQEPYDMYGMTAAHKSLPLPTYVRVRNLQNNRSIVVRVNDRGPFIDNRLIDLCYTAALKLDLVGAGTGLVEVTAISVDEPLPNRASPTTAAAAKSDVDLFVQVGAFGDQENARRRLRMLRSNGFKQSFVFTDRQSQATLYRVRIGPIADVAEFDKIIDRLRDVGIAESHLVSD